jgi:hypothetical protein
LVVFGKDIAIYPHAIDRYRSTVAVVDVDGWTPASIVLRELADMTRKITDSNWIESLDEEDAF